MSTKWITEYVKEQADKARASKTTRTTSGMYKRRRRKTTRKKSRRTCGLTISEIKAMAFNKMKEKIAARSGQTSGLTISEIAKRIKPNMPQCGYKHPTVLGYVCRYCGAGKKPTFTGGFSSTELLKKLKSNMPQCGYNHPMVVGYVCRYCGAGKKPTTTALSVNQLLGKTGGMTPLEYFKSKGAINLGDLVAKAKAAKPKTGGLIKCCRGQCSKWR